MISMRPTFKGIAPHILSANVCTLHKTILKLFSKMAKKPIFIDNCGLISRQKLQLKVGQRAQELIAIYKKLIPGLGEWHGIVVFLTACHSKGQWYKSCIGHFCGFYSYSL